MDNIRPIPRECVLCGGKTGKPALWTPVLMLYALPNTVPAPAILGVKVCDDCRDTATLDNFLTDEGLAVIQRVFAAAGRMRPRREYSRLEWDLTEDEHPFAGTPFDPERNT